MIFEMRGAVLAGLTAASLVAAAPAQAVTLVPPGKAGADQYFETIPGAGGNSAPPVGAPSSGTAGGAAARTLAPFGGGRRGAARLARLGATGQAAAALAGATAPSPVAGHPPRVALDGSSPLTAVTKALGNTSSGGLGLILPLVMATALVLALAVIGRRLLLRHQEPPELGA